METWKEEDQGLRLAAVDIALENQSEAVLFNLLKLPWGPQGPDKEGT